MMTHVLTVLAQMDQSKLAPDDPRLGTEASNGMTWVIVAIILAAILAVTFKTSKRNVMVDTTIK